MDQSLTEAAFRQKIVSALRKICWFGEPFKNARNNARVERGVYRCDGCHMLTPSSVYCPKKEKRVPAIKVDHIDPVVPLTGWVSWNNYIERMFVDSDGLQLLCLKCHERKTKEENMIRKENEKFRNQPPLI